MIIVRKLYLCILIGGRVLAWLTIEGVQENLLVNKFYGQATKGMR